MLAMLDREGRSARGCAWVRSRPRGRPCPALRSSAMPEAWAGPRNGQRFKPTKELEFARIGGGHGARCREHSGRGDCPGKLATTSRAASWSRCLAREQVAPDRPAFRQGSPWKRLRGGVCYLPSGKRSEAIQRRYSGRPDSLVCCSSFRLFSRARSTASIPSPAQPVKSHTAERSCSFSTLSIPSIVADAIPIPKDNV